MELAKQALKGDVRAAAKLIRSIEDELPEATEELAKLYSHTGSAHIVGITGSPGSGKSTLVDTLIDAFRRRDKTVGVIAIDPSSPFTGGSILGDRIRMQRHCMDEGVFIRSLATRGWHGGLSKAAVSIMHVMDAMGKDIILVETVGVGQGEVDVINAVHTSIVTLVPGMGDSIQTIKAGILEIADIFVINKMDKEGVWEIKAEIEAMLQMRTYSPGSWRPPVFLTSAVANEGIDEVVEGIYQHNKFLTTSGKRDLRLRERAKIEFTEALKSSFVDCIFREIDKDGGLERLLDDLAHRRTDPYSAAANIMRKAIPKCGSPSH
jgi:LAO/AO transport system kinase